MATDLTIILENRPGTLAEMGEALGKAGINIKGLCGFPCQGMGLGHILVKDGAAARNALEAAGIEVRDERPVLVVGVKDRPGKGGKLARRLADAGVNVDLVYLSTKGKLVFGVDDLEKAKAALA